MIQADANHLFCGRSGLAFECWIEPKELRSTVMTLDDTQTTPAQNYTPRRIVGVGNVGRTWGQATYTLYNPANNHVTFKTVKYSKAKGFALQRSWSRYGKSIHVRSLTALNAYR